MQTDKLEAMRHGGKILAQILSDLKDSTKPGTTKKELDDLSKRLCLKYGVKPSFLNYGGFPGALCVSVNHELVHGLPDESVITEGDLVSLDFGVNYKGYHTDSALTFAVSEVPVKAKELMRVAEDSLYVGIDQAKVGNHVGDIGAAIQKYVEDRGFGIVRSLVGHGIGKDVHEEPMVPNFGEKGQGPILKEGMTIAIEPMITAGHFEVVQSKDGWTFETKDESLCAHFEHTIYISSDGPEILTKI
jgi:methionyl aminopeptidase